MTMTTIITVYIYGLRLTIIIIVTCALTRCLLLHYNCYCIIVIILYGAIVISGFEDIENTIEEVYIKYISHTVMVKRRFDHPVYRDVVYARVFMSDTRVYVLICILNITYDIIIIIIISRPTGICVCVCVHCLRLWVGCKSKGLDVFAPVQTHKREKDRFIIF